MSDLIRLSAADVARTVRDGKTSAREVTDAVLAHVDAVDDRVGSYLTRLHDLRAQRRDRVDERVRAGEHLPLAGVPVAVKDNMCLTGTRTTCGSKILENWISPYTGDGGAADSRRRRHSDRQSQHGRVRDGQFVREQRARRDAQSVRSRSRVPGGFAGGSAAAVAAYEAAIGLGSDTGGSIREPGAFCNLVGFKPTYGRVSRYGLIAFASSLDQIGPLTRTVEDAALAYDAMAGHDPMDSTSIDRPVEPAVERAARGSERACASASSSEFDHRKARRARSTRSTSRPTRDLERPGRRARRGLAADCRLRPGDVLPDRAGRVLPQPRALRRRSLRPARRRRRRRADVRATRAPQASGRR